MQRTDSASSADRVSFLARHFHKRPRSQSDAITARRPRPLSVTRVLMETDGGRRSNLRPRDRADSTMQSFQNMQEGRVQIHRPVWNHEEFDDIHAPTREEDRPMMNSLHETIFSRCSCSMDCFKKFCHQRVPCIKQMKSYRWRQWLPGDLMSGMTVGIMQLPQGMAYAMLAELPPIYGLYVSFFPALIYFIFGTSKHINVGTFAVVCLMVGAIVNRESLNYVPGSHIRSATLPPNGTISDNGTFGNITNGTTPGIHGNAGKEHVVDKELILFKVGVATAVALMTGLWQLVMGVFQFGFVTIYLGDPLVSGFTTGAACHVLTSQVKHVFGLKIQRFTDPFTIPNTYIAIFKNIGQSNVASVITAVICILALYLTKEYGNPRFKKRFKAPIPIELIVVVLGTIVSYFAKLEETFEINVVGEIPTGIPAPRLPVITSMSIVGDSFAIAVVAFAISVSMGKLLAQKQNYEINPNQELIAFGMCNIFGAFFNCFPCCASLSRSLVQENVGGKTQLAAVTSCFLIFIVLMVMGPLFESLPNAVLAAIIIVALKGMFMQFKELKRLWKLCKYDFAIWLITWLAVVLLGVELGLAIGVGFSLLTVVFRTQSPYVGVCGRVPHSDIYKDITNYKTAREIPGVKVINFLSSLYYANAEHFRNKVYQLSGAHPLKVKAAWLKAENTRNSTETEMVQMNGSKRQNGHISDKHNGSSSSLSKEESVSLMMTKRQLSVPSCDIHHIILDCSTMSYIDSVGIKFLSQVIKEYKEINVEFFLSNCRGTVREMLNRSNFHDEVPRAVIYVTTHDAVLSALKKHADLRNKIYRDSVELVEQDARTEHPQTPPLLRLCRSPTNRSNDTIVSEEEPGASDDQQIAPLVSHEDTSVFEEVDV